MSFDLQLINNDICFDSKGLVKTVEDTPKLRQDIIKMIMTPLGANKNHPWYGCPLGDNISGKNLPFNILDSVCKTDIFDSISKLKMLQKSQSSTQKVSLAEMIESIIDVYLERDTSDGRNINIFISILTKRMTKFDEYFTIIS